MASEEDFDGESPSGSGKRKKSKFCNYSNPSPSSKEEEETGNKDPVDSGSEEILKASSGETSSSSSTSYSEEWKASVRNLPGPSRAVKRRFEYPRNVPYGSDIHEHASQEVYEYCGHMSEKERKEVYDSIVIAWDLKWSFDYRPGEGDNEANHEKVHKDAIEAHKRLEAEKKARRDESVIENSEVSEDEES